jgi:hypothetical protein
MKARAPPGLSAAGNACSTFAPTRFASNRPLHLGEPETAAHELFPEASDWRADAWPHPTAAIGQSFGESGQDDTANGYHCEARREEVSR